jgi:hypothetical protein
MPVDFTDPEGTTTRQTDPKTEGSMFAPTPLWDRAPKARRRAAATTRRPRNDPAMEAGEPGAGAGVIGATTAAEPLDIAYETQAAGTEPRVRRRGVGTAVAAGVVVVAALGAVGWYASQPRAQGVAELTPGAPASSQVALNTAAPPANPAPVSSAPAPDSATTVQDSATTTTRPATPAAPRPTAKSVATRAPAPRVRPANNASALSSGVDAGTTAPVVNTPAPTPSVSPMQATPPVNPIMPTPAPATPSTTAPPAGSTDDSAAPTASTPAAPTATP